LNDPVLDDSAGEQLMQHNLTRDEVETLRGAIIAQLHGIPTLERRPTPPSYRAGLVVCAVVMLALPLVYAAFTVAVAYGVYAGTVAGLVHATLTGAAAGEWQDADTLTLEANALLRATLDGDESFESAMAFVSVLVRQNEVDLSRYLSAEQITWLDEEGFSPAEQQRLVRDIRGFDLRRDRNPMPIDDNTLRAVVEDQALAARAGTMRSAWYLAARAACVVAAIAGFFTWHAITSEPSFKVTVAAAKAGLEAKHDLLYEVALMDGMPLRGFPKRTERVVRRGDTRIYMYVRWLDMGSVSKADLEVLNHHDERAYLHSVDVGDGMWHDVYVPINSATPLGDMSLRVHINGEPVSRHRIALTDAFIYSGWAIILWWLACGLAYLLVGVVYSRIALNAARA
jgi:hypothetical protein